MTSDGLLAVEDRFGGISGRVYLTGIQALARLPIDCRRVDTRSGLKTAAFISGYEGSPLAGYDLELAKRSALLKEHDIVFSPAVNEELAATSVQGSQLASASSRATVDGVTGWWYGKSPGLDRAADAIRHNNLMGTHPAGGVVALVGDDPAAKSSTSPGSSDALLADLGVPTLYPADMQDVLDFGQHAVALSRASGLWTALKVVTNVADASGIARVDPQRITPVRPTVEYRGKPYRHAVTAHVLQPVLDELELTRETVRLELARRYCVANNLNVVGGRGDSRIGIVAAGKTYADLVQALQMMGLSQDELARRGVRLMKFAMIYPLDRQEITAFARGLREVIVVEEKRPFLEAALKEVLYGVPDAPRILGKQDSAPAEALARHGELDADKIAAALATTLLRLGDFPSVESWSATRRPTRTPIALPLLSRTPYFCSGCPHNRSAKTPAGAQVGAGIGCHGLVVGMDAREFGDVVGLTQMGGEGAQWIGMAPFVVEEHFIQNLGDGTFHHSGSLAIRNSVAAGVNITYKLLHNSAVAMTGGQQPAGELTLSQLIAALQAEGVREVLITTDDPRRLRPLARQYKVGVWHRDRLMEAQEHLGGVPGVTVLIHDQECAAELRRKRKRGLAPDPVERVFINERVCEGCGDCGRKSNCLSVQPVATEFGRKTRIDQASCNRDYSCLDGDCPAFISVVPATERPRTGAKPREHFPEPTRRRFIDGQYTIRLLGVGGTGVVTLSQLLSTAAAACGLSVHTLDQTGMSQKGGAVASDIKFTEQHRTVGSKAVRGEVDLVLGCDLLVSAAPANLALLDPNRTVAAISTSELATGAMVSDPSVLFPERDELIERIRAATVRPGGVFVDVRRVTTEVFEGDELANVVLAGAAYQAGFIPITAAAFEKAITANRVKVDENISAFRWGRQMVAYPETVPGLDNTDPVVPAGLPSPEAARSICSVVKAPEDSEVMQLITRRVSDLIGYQNARYAKRYADFVETVRSAEQQCGIQSMELTESVARYLYKLMAYKDEYEVARLSLDSGLSQQISAEFGPGARIKYRLHPPMLRALGMKSKVSLGSWVRPIFVLLYAARRLRHTPLDPFGYLRMRKTERALIDEYRRCMEEILPHLSPSNHPYAVALAALPDVIRGYEEIKMRNIETYHENLFRTIGEFRAARAGVA